jgi:general stress protein YciG
MEISTSNIPNTPTDATSARRLRGFAVMDRALQLKIASSGGVAVHRSGRAHRFNSDQAQEAGRKGGIAVSRDSEHMARIGSLGGRSRHLRATHESPDDSISS